jgi:hypothetical protein
MATEQLVLSGSSVATYRRCPQWWYYEYIQQLVRPPRLQMARGLAAHEAVEFDLKHKVATWHDAPREQVVDLYIDRFVEYSKDSPRVQGKDTIEDIFRRGVLAVEAWYDNVAPDIFPLFVEVNGRFEVDGVLYDWTADVIDQSYLVRDWKFVKKKPQPGSPFSPDYTYPMRGYYMGAETELDIELSGWQIDYMVCTLHPYLVSDTHMPLDQADRDDFRDVVVETHDRIMEGQFPPRGLGNNACSWCPFADGTCEAYRRKTIADESRYQDDEYQEGEPEDLFQGV